MESNINYGATRNVAMHNSPYHSTQQTISSVWRNRRKKLNTRVRNSENFAYVFIRPFHKIMVKATIRFAPLSVAKLGRNLKASVTEDRRQKLYSMPMFHNLFISLALSNWVIAHNDVEERGIAKNTTETVSHLSKRDAKRKNS